MWEGKTNIFITDPISELSNKGGLKYNVYITITFLNSANMRQKQSCSQ